LLGSNWFVSLEQRLTSLIAASALFGANWGSGRAVDAAKPSPTPTPPIAKNSAAASALKYVKRRTPPPAASFGWLRVLGISGFAHLTPKKSKFNHPRRGCVAAGGGGEPWRPPPRPAAGSARRLRRVPARPARARSPPSCARSLRGGTSVRTEFA